MTHRRAAKVDTNQAEVIDHLRAAGALVRSLAAVGKGFPDLVVYHPRLVTLRPSGLVLLEVKDGKRSPSRRRLTAEQEAFHAQWPAFIVKSWQEALAVIGQGQR